MLFFVVMGYKVRNYVDNEQWILFFQVKFLFELNICVFNDLYVICSVWLVEIVFVCNN